MTLKEFFTYLRNNSADIRMHHKIEICTAHQRLLRLLVYSIVDNLQHSLDVRLYRCISIY